MLDGRLFAYATGLAGCTLSAFESAVGEKPDSGERLFPSPLRSLVLIGGLSDGLMGIGYEEDLAHALELHGVSLVQPVFSSSYRSYGISSLDQDAEELAKLLDFLIHRLAKQEIFLMGHSTGCQDIVHFAKKFGSFPPQVRALLLQAPVSDREFFAHSVGKEEYERLISLSAIPSLQKELKNEIDDSLMPFSTVTQNGTEIPISKSRFASLYAKGGADDLFSLDLTLAEWQRNFENIRVPVAVFLSERDQFWVPGTNVEEDVVGCFEAASPFVTKIVVIPEADHSVKANRQFLLDQTVSFVMEHFNP